MRTAGGIEMRWQIVRARVVTVLYCSLTVASTAVADVVRVETVVGGLDRVTGIIHVAAAGDQLYIAEQSGRVRVYGDGVLAAVPFLDITTKVLSSGFEQGLTGLAFAPDFPVDPRAFVHYIRGDGASVISQFLLDARDPRRADPDSELVMLVVEQPHPTHNCNQLAFGPDRMLYIGCGDGGSGSGPILDPQSLTRLLGKILRIDVDELPPGLPYLIPPGNPYLGTPGARPEIWANGLRNPYRFSFDSTTGDLWLADVGQASWEEINRVEATAAGVNYGWPILEGNHCWPPGTTCNDDGFHAPTHEYAHTQARCSVIGGMRVRDSGEQALDDSYLFADFCTAEIFALREAAANVFVPLRLGRADGHLPSTFGIAADGSVLVGMYAGSILRIVVVDAVFDDGFEP
jgi:glucose/arabinose dehydrogenase